MRGKGVWAHRRFSTQPASSSGESLPPVSLSSSSSQPVLCEGPKICLREPLPSLEPPSEVAASDNKRHMDDPLVQVDRKRGTAGRAQWVLRNPLPCAQAEAEFEDAMLSTRGAAPSNSRVRTLTKLAVSVGFDALLPLDKHMIRVISGAMRKAGYSSLDQYLDLAKAVHQGNDFPWPGSLERYFQRAKNAAVLGIGPCKRAGLVDVDALHNIIDDPGAVMDGSPLYVGRMAAIGIWWLLREIELSLLRIRQVVVRPDEQISWLNLGVTKKDIRGDGCSRGHHCTCGSDVVPNNLCPVHILIRQLQTRSAMCAGPEDPLFGTLSGDVASKEAVVASLRNTLTPAGKEEISGHSLRRTGAQWFVTHDVSDAMVEWFGRWSSSAMRAYIQDARSRASSSCKLSLSIAGLSSDSSSPPAPSALQLEGDSSLSLRLGALEDAVQSLADRPLASPAAMPSLTSAQDSGSDNVSVIGVVNMGRTRDLSSKRGVALHSLHLAPLVVHRNVASARVAFCSWRYGRSSSALVVESSDIGSRHDVAACDNCWKIAEKRGFTVPVKPSSSSSTISTDPVQEEAQDSSSSASSSSSDSS